MIVMCCDQSGGEGPAGRPACSKLLVSLGSPGTSPVANAFDPYREALVVEHHTIWPTDYEDWSEDDKARVERLLHAGPAEAAELDYIRQHTGFARVITVTPADLDRVSVT